MGTSSGDIAKNNKTRTTESGGWVQGVSEGTRTGIGTINVQFWKSIWLCSGSILGTWRELNLKYINWFMEKMSRRTELSMSGYCLLFLSRSLMGDIKGQGRKIKICGVMREKVCKQILKFQRERESSVKASVIVTITALKRNILFYTRETRRALGASLLTLKGLSLWKCQFTWKRRLNWECHWRDFLLKINCLEMYFLRVSTAIATVVHGGRLHPKLAAGLGSIVSMVLVCRHVRHYGSRELLRPTNVRSVRRPCEGPAWSSEGWK